MFPSNRSGKWKLFRQDLDQVTPELVGEVGPNFVLPRLNPDGTKILYSTGYEPDDHARLASLMEMPLFGGPARKILQMSLLSNFQCARSPSKVCVLSTHAERAGRLYQFDEEDGATRNFAEFKMNGLVSWSLSPDGSQVAIAYTHGEPKVVFMNMANHSMHDVELHGWLHIHGVDWTGAGKSVYVIALKSDGTSDVAEVEPSGNYRLVLPGNEDRRYWWAIQSPDGRHVLLEQIPGENNVWMVENF